MAQNNDFIIIKGTTENNLKRLILNISKRKWRLAPDPLRSQRPLRPRQENQGLLSHELDLFLNSPQIKLETTAIRSSSWNHHKEMIKIADRMIDMGSSAEELLIL